VYKLQFLYIYFKSYIISEKYGYVYNMCGSFYRMAAELDNGSLIEQPTGVEKQGKNSAAREPATHATQSTLGAYDQVLLVRVLLVERSNAVVKDQHAGFAIERNEQRNEQRTN